MILRRVYGDKAKTGESLNADYRAGVINLAKRLLDIPTVQQKKEHIRRVNSMGLRKQLSFLGVDETSTRNLVRFSRYYHIGSFARIGAVDNGKVVLNFDWRYFVVGDGGIQFVATYNPDCEALYLSPVIPAKNNTWARWSGSVRPSKRVDWTRGRRPVSLSVDRSSEGRCFLGDIATEETRNYRPGTFALTLNVDLSKRGVAWEMLQASEANYQTNS